MRLLITFCVLVSLPALAEDFHDRIASVLSQTPLIDGHNDIPGAYKSRVDNHLDKLDFASDLTQLERPTHTDLPRLKKGMVGGQFWSVYIPIREFGGTPGDASRVLDQIDLVYRLVDKYPDRLAMAYTAADVRRIHGEGKIASLMGIEGGHAIEDSLANLRMMYQVGVRYMTLTHSKGLRWADSATDEPRIGGLSLFGKEVVREMNRLGMLVDLSHVSPDVMHDALDIAEAPVIFSHSSVYALTRHKRNVPDDVLKRIPENGGVVMVTFLDAYVSEEVRLDREERRKVRERFLAETEDEKAATAKYDAWNDANPGPKATLSQVADHIDHIKNLIGVDYIGLGGDYDGMPPGPIGLEDVSKYPDLFAELLKRGYSDADIAKIAGENVLRVMAKAEVVAEEIRKTRPPSDVHLEELDPPLEDGQPK